MIIVMLQMGSRLIYPAILLTSAIAWDASPASKPLVLIGAPGSGKNVQSAFLERELNLPIISVDQLVKDNPQAVASIQTIGVPDHRIRASIAAEWPKDRVFRNPQPAKTDRNRSIPIKQPSCQTDGGLVQRRYWACSGSGVSIALDIWSPEHTRSTLMISGRHRHTAESI